MSCYYCYEERKDMSSEREVFCSSRDVIEFLNGYKDYLSVFIVFHGGEPLLADKKVICEILEFLDKNFINNYNIQFQTNGTLLDHEWINIFNKYSSKISLSISLDPIGDFDLRRSNSFKYRERVIENLKLINKSKIKNIGIISVAHKYNINYFEAFTNELITLGIKNLTINKYRTQNLYNDKYYISEEEYNNMLKKLIVHLIKEKIYRNINIQPIISLLSNNPNRLCTYLADTYKCKYFKVFYNKNNYRDYCNHLKDEVRSVDLKCLKCDIYNWCGSGCLAEKKDRTFCTSRRNLKLFLEEIKNENR